MNPNFTNVRYMSLLPRRTDESIIILLLFLDQPKLFIWRTYFVFVAMNEFLYQEICDACISRTKMPDRLLMEHMIIVAALHTSIGAEVGMGYLNFHIFDI